MPHHSGRRSATITSLLSLLLVASGCGALPGSSQPTGEGAGAAEGAGPPADPLTFTPQSDAAATGTVTLDEGGTITATATDGTTFELAVPAEAVAGDTEITLTPLADIGGIDAGAAHAVLLEPDGLEFHELARLTITPAEPIPVEEQLMFEAAGDGASPTLALVDPASEPIVILLDHFSVAGIATADEQQRAAFLEKSAADAAERLARQVRARIAAERVRQLLGTADEESNSVAADALEDIRAEYEREVLEKRRQAGEESCRALRTYVQSVISWERQLQLVGTSDADAEASGARIAAALAFAQQRYDECEQEAIAACDEADDPQILIDFWMWMDFPVNKARADELCRADSFRLEFIGDELPVTTGVGAIDVEGHVTGCPTDEGGWILEGEITIAYPNSPVTLNPSSGQLFDVIGGQTPERFTLHYGPVTDTSSVTFTDALGNATGEFHWVNNLDETDGPFPIEVIRTEHECEQAAP
jgi:hypothetical protein